MMKSQIAVVAAALSLALPTLAGDALKEAFEAPPLTARPLVWWNWPKGFADKTMMAHELEALKEQGFGGAQIYDWGDHSTNFWGDVPFNSPEWQEDVAFAVKKAEDLGLEIGLNHVSGWNGTSGPWIKSAEAMKEVVVKSVEVTGPCTFDGPLPALAPKGLFAKDIRLLACPVSEEILRERTRFTVTSTLTDDAKWLSNLSCGQWTSGRRIAAPKTAQFEFVAEKPEQVAGLEYQLRGSYIRYGRHGVKLTVSYQDASGAWKDLQTTTARLSGGGLTQNTHRRVSVGPVMARRFRLVFEMLVPDTWAEIGALRLYTREGIPDIDRKNLSTCGVAPETLNTVAGPSVLAKDAPIDLTGKLTSDGRLRWEVPAGTWRLLRIGCADSMRRANTGSPNGNGPICDVMDKKAVEKHFRTFLEPLVERTYGKDRRIRTTGLTHAFFDSFEGRYQNWCVGFAEEFEKRNGYSILPYLPLFDEQAVGSVVESNRVLWDFRQTAAQLINERYGTALREESNRLGLTLYHEGVGDGNVDTIDFTLCGDVPMSEFWMGSPDHCSIPPIVSAAHLSGKSIVASEAFTSGPENLGWGHDALRLKQATDCALASGVNRFVYHCFLHNPFAAKYRPGIRMGYWGTHMEPTQTWWEYVGGSIVGYQDRASALLQAGRPVVDALVFAGENEPNGGQIGGANLPQGVRSDFINRSLVLQLTTKDGDLVLPSGARYRLLVFPTYTCLLMTPELMEKLVALAKDGARLVLPKMPARSPSFRGYPACDARVQALAKELEPLVFAKNTSAAFKKAGIGPDVTFAGLDNVRWNHTRYADGSEGYFLARTNGVAACGSVTFRATGQAVELWDAETGEIVSTEGRVANGRTTVDLAFKPTGSVFVMFRPQPTAGATSQWKGKEVAATEAEATWKLTFPTGWYYNEPDVKSIELKKLVDWTTLDDPDFKYFSGKATYEATLAVSRPADGARVFLDLGTVKNFAVVTVGEKTYPVLWRPPYRVDVTDAARAAADGKLVVSVHVTNLWPNRLIGDAALPTDCEWNDNGTLVRIPDWVKKGEKSPTGRHTFMTYNKLLTKDTPLLPSGLIGPVRFVTERE